MTKINPLSKIAKQLGTIGGKKSVQVRFKGKSKAEISEIMSKVRLSPIQEKNLDRAMQGSLRSLRKNIKISTDRRIKNGGI